MLIKFNLKVYVLLVFCICCGIEQFEKKEWKHDIEDILYALQSKKIINLNENKGKIISININV